MTTQAGGGGVAMRPQAQGHLEPRSWKGRKDPTWSLFREHGPAHAGVSGSWPPDL